MTFDQATVLPSRRIPRRTLQLMAGLVLYAASISMLVHAGLGNMPWDVLSQGISRQLGWSLGTVTIVVSIAVLLCWVPLRQRPGWGTVANVLVIGLLVDPFLALLALVPEPVPLWGAIALTVGGILANGVATACYIGARLGPGPRDGLMTGLVTRTGGSVRVVRFGIEGVVVLGGWLLGGTVGLGTLGYAVAIGPLVHALLPRFTVRAGTVGEVGATPEPAGATGASVGHPA
ncbi:YitT family protein [Actinotalea sp. K2]|uniref:membrane protein YczE n=1 Tax=Actinotalea sp. K2 TaxID=2939438 RepID=UPI002017771C|nr:hypothetical protein [Actinotalea sp. K2]MCL3860724.1 hypothetical protein [Actinotalea sp. K2]